MSAIPLRFSFLGEHMRDLSNLQSLEVEAKLQIKELDTPAKFSTMFYKGDKYCNFLFAFLHTNSFFKRKELAPED